jgi:hypothetical protein
MEKENTTIVDKNEVKKELYRTKVMAKLSHYVGGNLYYTVELIDGIYQFPISTIEEYQGDFDIKMIALSSDLGTTSFYNEMKGSELNRWVGKAIDSGDFIKIN